MIRRFYQNHRALFQKLDTLWLRSPILTRGLAIAPLIVVCNSVLRACALSLCYGLMLVLTVIFSRPIPQTLPYTIRVILNVSIAAILFIPASYLTPFPPGAVPSPAYRKLPYRSAYPHSVSPDAFSVYGAGSDLERRRFLPFSRLSGICPGAVGKRSALRYRPFHLVYRSRHTSSFQRLFADGDGSGVSEKGLSFPKSDAEIQTKGETKP